MGAGIRIFGARQAAPRLPRRRFACARLARSAVALGLSSLLALTLAVTPALSATEQEGGLEFLGYLNGNVSFVDSENRRAYAFKGTVNGDIAEYDLSGSGLPVLTQQFKASGVGNGVSGMDVVHHIGLDSPGKRAFLLGGTGLERGADRVVRVLDLDSTHSTHLTYLQGIEWSFYKVTPGLFPLGVTYAPASGLLYVTAVTSNGVHEVVSDWYRRPAAPVFVVALKLVDPQGNYTPNSPASVAWVKQVPQCQMVMWNINSPGAFIAVTRDEGKLHFACMRRRGQPGQSGVVRIWITPGAGYQEAAGFRTDFFPISGLYTGGGLGLGEGMSGRSAFDPISERFFLQSQAEDNPGVWVLDGKLDAWTGFIAATNQNLGIGVDVGSGHLFMNNGTDVGLRVADIRTKPVSQGRVFPIPPASNRGVFPTDPVAHRVFFMSGSVSDSNVKTAVYLDQTLQGESLSPTDHDSHTQDVAEGLYTSSEFDAKATGFGARALIVGGYRGAISATGAFNPIGLAQIPQPNLCTRYTVGEREVDADSHLPEQQRGCLFPKDRDVHGTAVGSLSVSGTLYGDDLSITKLTADARAVSPSDEASENEWKNRTGGGWPWSLVSCDASQGSQAKFEHGGWARTDCDEKSAKALASSFFGGGSTSLVADLLSQANLSGEEVDEAASKATLRIASTSFDSDTYLDSAQGGMVSYALASAKGVELSLPGSGSLAIRQVSSEARAFSGGRPGKARAHFTRRISGVEVKDHEGKALFSSAGCQTSYELAPPNPNMVIGGFDSCSTLSKALNQFLGVKVRIDLPTPSLTATPKGAFAEVRKTDADHYQGVVIHNEADATDNTTWSTPAMEVSVSNDSDEKSRLVAQLAGSEVYTIYKISCSNQIVSGACQGLPEDPDQLAPEDQENPGEGSILEDLLDDPFDFSLAGALEEEAPSLIERVKEIIRRIGELPAALLRFLIRSPKEALLFIGMWLLLAAGPSIVWRRRLLVRALAA